jgi:hypothetical protein
MGLGEGAGGSLSDSNAGVGALAASLRVAYADPMGGTWPGQVHHKGCTMRKFNGFHRGADQIEPSWPG